MNRTARSALPRLSLAEWWSFLTSSVTRRGLQLRFPNGGMAKASGALWTTGLSPWWTRKPFALSEPLGAKEWEEAMVRSPAFHSFLLLISLASTSEGGSFPHFCHSLWPQFSGQLESPWTRGGLRDCEDSHSQWVFLSTLLANHGWWKVEEYVDSHREYTVFQRNRIHTEFT